MNFHHFECTFGKIKQVNKTGILHIHGGLAVQLESLVNPKDYRPYK